MTHSLVTHAVILPVIPALAIAISGSNYKIKNLIHAFIFNLTLVGIMIIVNYTVNNGWDVVRIPGRVHAIAGELTRTNMKNNALVGFLPWPFNMVLWIFAVMMLEWIYFFFHRLIIWRTYQRHLSLKQTFKDEFAIDAPQWYGFKLWGKHNWPQRWLNNAKIKWVK